MNQMTNNTPNNSQFDTGDIFSTLFNRVKQIIAPPVFPDDEDKTRHAAILNTLLLAALVISAFYSFSVFITSNRPLLVAALVALVQALLVVSLIMLRRGYVTQTASVVIAFFWLFVTVLSTLYGTVINPIIPTFVIVIFAAGILINTRTSVFLSVLTLMYFVTFLVLQNRNVLPHTLEVTSTNFMLRLAFNVLMAAFFIYVSNRTTSQTLNQLQQTRQDLLDSNQEMSEIRTYLEETVTERTLQLEKRNRYLEAASQVASQSLATLDLQEMLDNIALLIAEQFGFYHVGIFLLDERKEWAVLRAVSSPGGRRMLARTHRLEVGRQGIVGFVTSVGQARITQDIELDRIHTVTAELPDTRAEMALPLKSRGQIIGALDIQESNPNAFAEEDIPVLQTVADQIALAVENIRLYQQAQENLEEIQRVYGEYSQQAWFETYQKNLLRSYRFASGVTETLPPGEEISLLENKVSIPIQIRGYNIGAIEIAKDENQNKWSDEELKLLQNLSDQLGIALDSARLYNETQLRASTEHVISQISSDIWETLEINAILKTAAQKLRDSLSVPEVTVRLAKPTTPEPVNGHDEPNAEPAQPLEEEIEE